MNKEVRDRLRQYHLDKLAEIEKQEQQKVLEEANKPIRGRPRIYEEVGDARKTAVKRFQNKRPFYNILAGIKLRCKNDNIEFDIKEEDLTMPETCPVLGIKLVVEKGNGLLDNGPSIHRIDPLKGYTKDNVLVISHLADRMKRNATPEQLLAFAKWITQTYGS